MQRYSESRLLCRAVAVTENAYVRLVSLGSMLVLLHIGDNAFRFGLSTTLQHEL